ncbi:MAG: hypothetical protein CM15mP17_13860 [Gammaproteobacteria bacterium]|nr:MAG: hypothetical protein CM15mP17_13860 [Gammaproteobacteria bacterium]
MWWVKPSQYGKVWLTYNLKLDNPASPNQGSFSGRAVAIDDDGNRTVLVDKVSGSERVL